jgi:hypothetical protein
MKLSRPLWASILIVSALLLSAVKNGSGATPSNNTPAAKDEKTPHQNDASARPTSAIGNQSGSAPASSQAGHYTYNYYYPARDTWLTFLGQIAAIASAVLLTIFTGGLWWTSIRQWRVMRDGNRPYLLFSHANLHAYGTFVEGNPIPEDGLTLADAEISFQNYGSGPALIQKAVGYLKIVQVRHFTRAHDFNNCSDLSYSDEIITGGGSTSFTFKFPNYRILGLSPSEYRTIWNGDKKPVFYGYVWYCDTFGARYTTEFCVSFTVQAPTRDGKDIGVKWFWVPGPRENNRRT